MHRDNECTEKNFPNFDSQFCEKILTFLLRNLNNWKFFSVSKVPVWEKMAQRIGNRNSANFFTKWKWEWRFNTENLLVQTHQRHIWVLCVICQFEILPVYLLEQYDFFVLELRQTCLFSIFHSHSTSTVYLTKNVFNVHFVHSICHGDIHATKSFGY